MPARIGRPKAAVLPEPVWAMPSMSRPSSNLGMAWLWIFVGSVKPPTVRLSVIRLGRPREMKSFKLLSFMSRETAHAPCRTCGERVFNMQSGDRDYRAGAGSKPGLLGASSEKVGTGFSVRRRDH